MIPELADTAAVDFDVFVTGMSRVLGVAEPDRRVDVFTVMAVEAARRLPADPATRLEGIDELDRLAQFAGLADPDERQAALAAAIRGRA